MPINPTEIGRKLIVVGDKQMATGERLENFAKQVRDVAGTLEENKRIAQSLGSAETGMRSTRSLLSPVSTTMHSIANAFKSVTVPSISKQTKTIDFPVVGEVTFVSGVSISSVHPFQSIGNSIETMADNVDNIRNSLEDIADALRDLKSELPNIRTHLLDGANEMQNGGKDLTAAGAGIKAVGTLLSS